MQEAAERMIELTSKHWKGSDMAALTMSDSEIFEVTGYKQPARQRRFFERLGIPVHTRPDGSVSVCRHHYLELKTKAEAKAERVPQLKFLRTAP